MLHGICQVIDYSTALMMSMTNDVICDDYGSTRGLGILFSYKQRSLGSKCHLVSIRSNWSRAGICCCVSH